jgi:hypothetical protein
MNDNQGVDVSELVLGAAYQLEAIIRLLEMKGVLSREELLKEIKLIRDEQQQGAGT